MRYLQQLPPASSEPKSLVPAWSEQFGREARGGFPVVHRCSDAIDGSWEDRLRVWPLHIAPETFALPQVNSWTTRAPARAHRGITGAMPGFKLPPIEQNDEDWGPTSVPEQWRDVPFVPFNKSDRLGRIADFSAHANQRAYQGAREWKSACA